MKTNIEIRPKSDGSERIIKKLDEFGKQVMVNSELFPGLTNSDVSKLEEMRYPKKFMRNLDGASKEDQKNHTEFLKMLAENKISASKLKKLISGYDGISEAAKTELNKVANEEVSLFNNVTKLSNSESIYTIGNTQKKVESLLEVHKQVLENIKIGKIENLKKKSKDAVAKNGTIVSDVNIAVNEKAGGDKGSRDRATVEIDGKIGKINDVLENTALRAGQLILDVKMDEPETKQEPISEGLKGLPISEMKIPVAEEVPQPYSVIPKNNEQMLSAGGAEVNEVDPEKIKLLKEYREARPEAQNMISEIDILIKDKENHEQLGELKKDIPQIYNIGRLLDILRRSNAEYNPLVLHDNTLLDVLALRRMRRILTNGYQYEDKPTLAFDNSPKVVLEKNLQVAESVQDLTNEPVEGAKDLEERGKNINEENKVVEKVLTPEEQKEKNITTVFETVKSEGIHKSVVDTLFTSLGNDEKGLKNKVSFKENRENIFPKEYDLMVEKFGEEIVQEGIKKAYKEEMLEKNKENQDKKDDLAFFENLDSKIGRRAKENVRMNMGNYQVLKNNFESVLQRKVEEMKSKNINMSATITNDTGWKYSQLVDLFPYDILMPTNAFREREGAMSIDQLTKDIGNNNMPSMLDYTKLNNYITLRTEMVKELTVAINQINGVEDLNKFQGESYGGRKGLVDQIEKNFFSYEQLKNVGAQENFKVGYEKDKSGFYEEDKKTLDFIRNNMQQNAVESKIYNINIKRGDEDKELAARVDSLVDSQVEYDKLSKDQAFIDFTGSVENYKDKVNSLNKDRENLDKAESEFYMKIYVTGSSKIGIKDGVIKNLGLKKIIENRRLDNEKYTKEIESNSNNVTKLQEKINAKGIFGIGGPNEKDKEVWRREITKLQEQNSYTRQVINKNLEFINTNESKVIINLDSLNIEKIKNLFNSTVEGGKTYEGEQLFRLLSEKIDKEKENTKVPDDIADKYYRYSSKIARTENKPLNEI